MEIKKFKHISFEEWLENGKNYKEELGAYCYQINRFCWDDKKSTYLCAVSLSNKNPLNIYTDKIFCRVYDDYGDIKKLKEWYDETIKELNIFWEELIKSTYIKEDNI